jgi:hypothetical protein
MVGQKGGSCGDINVLVPTAEVRTHEIEMAQRPAALDGKTVRFNWNLSRTGTFF